MKASIRVMRLLILLVFPCVAFADVSPRRRFIDPRRFHLVSVREAGPEFVFGAAASGDGRLIAAGRRDGKIAMFRPDRNAPQVIEGHTGYVHAVRFGPGAAVLASAGLDGRIRLCDPRTGLETGVLPGTAPIHALAFSSDGAFLVSGGADGVRVWEVRKGAVKEYWPHKQPVFCVSIHGSRIAAGDASGAIRVARVDAPAEMRSFPAASRPITGLAFSPDGDSLAITGSDGRLRLWNVSTQAFIWDIEAHRGSGHAVVWTPDGRTIATAGADGLRFWNRHGARVAERACGAAATGIAFTEGGASLVATFADNRIRVWSLGLNAIADAAEAPVADRAPGFLGISYSDGGGAVVSSTIAGTQAEAIGLQANDVIIGVDGRTIEKSDDFLEFMRTTFEGDEILLRVKRDAEEKYFRVKLGRWN